ncbi:MAG: Ger(x)C family spore germination protein [Bacillota bacterium]|nr:Ger(x)C family spore germination protein [Bacillota bacterium]
MNRLILLLCLAFLLTAGGCGTVQIEDRAFVTAIGLDVVGTGEDAKYLVTTEIFRPGSMQPRVEDETSILQTVEADNFEAALEQLQARLPRVITLSHLRVIIVGEDAAKEFDFREVIDYFERRPEVQMRVRLMAVQGGQALELLKAKPLFNEYISEEIVALIQRRDYLSLTNANPFFQFVQELRVNEGVGLIPRILTTEDGTRTILHGEAVYNNYKLAGWLSSEEVHAANWILGDVDRSSVEGQLDNNAFSYSVRRRKVKIIPELNQQQLRFTVKIQTAGILRQQQGMQLDMSDTANIKKLEEVIAHAIVRDAQQAVKKSQQDFGIDYLGFGSALRRHNRQFYEQIQWEKTFPAVPIDVEAESRITLTGKKW